MIDYNEDTRVFQNNRLYVKDHQNVSFIYDETLRDLSAVEQEVLKIITVFINKDSGKTAISSKYMEALRFRLADRVGTLLLIIALLTFLLNVF